MAKKPKCGTVAGYQAHHRRGEEACEACKEARAEYSRKKRAGLIKPRSESQELKRAKDIVLGSLAKEAMAAVDAPVTGSPDFLKEDGRRLWDEVTSEFELNAAGLRVLENACRIGDLLGRFAGALSSKHVFLFELGDADDMDGEGVPVVVNSIVAEYRQLSGAQQRLLNSIGVLGKASAKKSGESVMDQLESKRRERLEAAKRAK